ncbi:MAG: hypothetical protein ACR2P1_27380 [Pseudomonadales bacterium]
MKESVTLRLGFVAALLIISFDLQARKIECHAGQSIRIIETRYPPAGSGIACNVTYHKPTEGVASKVLWDARNDVEYCGNKAWLLANKLENGGWICNSIYEATEGNEVVRLSRTTNGSDNADAPASPLAFRKFLEENFSVVFQAKADYYYGQDEEDCIETDCKKFFDYRSQFITEPVSFFGYNVSAETKLWMDLECDGSHCWGHLYKEREDIQKLLLPEFETGVAFNIFLKSQNDGFPDLWLPISHSSSNTVEVKLLRYVDGSYKTLAHLLAKPEPKMQAGPESDTALQAGVVTLKSSYGGESLELVYQTKDIDYEGLLLNPSE